MNKSRALVVLLAVLLLPLLFAGHAMGANPIPAGWGPYAVLANPIDREVYVANFWSDDVTFIDSQSDSVIGTVSVGAPGKFAAPVALAYNPLTGRLYVVNYQTARLVVIRANTRTLETSIAVGSSHGNPRSVVVNPDTNLVYMTTLGVGPGKVYVIDGDPGRPTLNQVLATISVGNYPRSAAVNTTLNRLYVANALSNTVSVIDIAPASPTYNQVVATVTVGSDPYALAINHSTAKVYVANRMGNTVSVIDGITNTRTGTVVTGTYPRALDVNPDRNLIYVTNRDSNTVTVIDGASDTVAATVPTGSKPYAVAAVRTPTGKTYVANYDAGAASSVTVINPDFSASQEPAGVQPMSLSIDTLLAKPKVFVANYGSSNVSVIDPDAQGSSLVTSIDRFPGDNTGNPTPVVSGTSTSLATPLAHKIMAVYYQIDSMEGTWHKAAIISGAGTSFVNWEIAVDEPLAPGAHTIRVVALDMTGATVTCSDGSANSTPYTGDIAAYDFSISAGNRPPTAEAGGPYSGLEGGSLTLDGSASIDPDGDSLTYAWDLDSDGTADVWGMQPTGVWWYDDREGVVALTVSDGRTSATDAALVTVHNVAPTADAGPDRTVFWGDEVTFVGSYVDPGANDLVTGGWMLGDGASADGLSATHVFADPGTYAATLAVRDKDGGIGADDAAITVERRPARLSYSGDLVGEYSDDAHVSASLVDENGASIAGRPAIFTVGEQSISAVTDILGQASADITLNQPAGEKALAVTFDGDAYYRPTSWSGALEVRKEFTALAYLGDAITQRYQTATLKAQLSEADASVGGLGGKEVVFTISDGMNVQTATAVTDTDGLATSSVKVTNPPGMYGVIASFAGDDFYQSSQSANTPYVIWQAISGLNVHGGGWLLNNGEKANFGFTARYLDGSDVPKGQLEFHDRSSGLNVHSDGFDWLILTAGNGAVLQGTATLNGQNEHLFRLIVSDIATPGKDRDSIELQIDAVPLAAGLLGGGNILIQ